MSSSRISISTIKKNSLLSRLHSSMKDEDAHHYLETLTQILDYADELNTIDTQECNPLDGMRTIDVADLRDDIPDESEEYMRVRSGILSNFPSSKNNLLCIDGIFESD